MYHLTNIDGEEEERGYGDHEKSSYDDERVGKEIDMILSDNTVNCADCKNAIENLR